MPKEDADDKLYALFADSRTCLFLVLHLDSTSWSYIQDNILKVLGAAYVMTGATF